MAVKIFSTSKSIQLANKISASYGMALNDSKLLTFSDGEFCPVLNENVRGETVFIISSLYSPWDDINKIMLMIDQKNHKEAYEIFKKITSSTNSVFELLQYLDAAKRASAKDIISVLVYPGWGRQDRKDRPRVPITAKLLANLIQTAGATRVITMDLHCDQISAFYDIPVDALQSSYIFIPYIESLNLKNLIFGAPDAGAGKRAKLYSDYFKTRMIFMHKERGGANIIDKMELIGDVNGCDVIFIDDIVDTAGTIVTAADILITKKGAKSVRACVPHAVLSGTAYEKIENSQLTELIITDSIPLIHQSSKIKVLSVADLFAKAINKMYNNESISNLFKK